MRRENAPLVFVVLCREREEEMNDESRRSSSSFFLFVMENVFSNSSRHF